MFPSTSGKQYRETGSRITFRAAVRGDAMLTLDFIRALAAHVNMPDLVSATPELLDEWLFEKKSAEVIFASVDDKEVGFALFFQSFSTFLGKAGMYLEDLFVLPDYRRLGVGRALLRELAAIAIKRGYGRLEWQCLDWNEPSIKFYKSLGAAAMGDQTTYRLSGSTLNGLALCLFPKNKP